MSPSSPTPDSSPRSSVGRGAVVGLCAGMLFGGLGLFAIGLRGLFGKPNCIGLAEQECELIVEAFVHVGRVQTICGGALIALSLSLFVLARPRFFPKPPAPTQSSAPPEAPTS